MVQNSNVEVSYEGSKSEVELERGDYLIGSGGAVYRVCQIGYGEIMLINMGNGNRNSFDTENGSLPIEDVSVEVAKECIEFSVQRPIQHVKGGDVTLTMEVEE
jgi:hypothetical protein